MSRRLDLPAAGRPAGSGRVSGRWRVQGLSSAGLALVLLLALIGTQRPAPEPAQPLVPAAPQAQPPVAAAPPRVGAPVRDARAVVTPRRAPAAGRAAPVRAPARRRVAAAARPSPAAAEAVPVHGPMERRYLPEAQGEGVCPAGTQSPKLGVACRGARVRQARGAGAGHLLQFQVCPTTTGRFDLRFAGEGEVAMRVVARSGVAVWTWRPPRPFADDAHVLVSEVGACWVWETPWRHVDDDGRAVPDATYFLEVDFLEVDDDETYTHRFGTRS